ncbi:MAG: SDR family NAD(P)-dependent oxidoreductase [bacterium]
MSKYGRNDFGIKVDGQAGDFLGELGSYLAEFIPDRLRYVLLTSGQIQSLRKIMRTFHDLGLVIFYESICLRQAQIGKELGADGIVAKGHEAGGRIGEDTTFVLLQKILSHLSLPVWAQGGIGLHTAAGCYAAGAEGIVLDSQLLLAQESPLPREVKNRLASMDGSETICLGERLGSLYRVYSRPNLPVIKELQGQEEHLVRLSASDHRGDSADHLAAWREHICQRAGWQSLEKDLVILGQDISFAPSLARKFATVGGILQGIRQSITAHLQSAASKGYPFHEGSSLAQSHDTRYPIVQGPMARISDVPEFARQVVKKGALPFIELAMMRGDNARQLLARCEKDLAGLSWGVGMLGFIPADLLKEQMDAILAHRPRFALIAGGKPEQAKYLEQQGIMTYLHCPSPGMLKLFLREGLKRFIFEGLECGGHLGPRSSFILWESCLEVLLDFLSTRDDASSCQVLLAGGIHDAFSSLIAALTITPLADLGVAVGIQAGSAYLFTEEAVSSGAIIQEFQQQALAAKGTIRLETSPGYVTRCLSTPFTRLFIAEKERMLSEGRPIEEVRNALESLNLGRLRIAAKGIDRQPSTDNAAPPQYVPLNIEEQRERGLYMIGQIAALRDRPLSIEALHQDICRKGAEKFEELINAEKKGNTTARFSAPEIPEVAVIGMACILPKASDVRAYWANILDKVNAIEEIPPDRWDYRLYYHADRKAQDKIYSKWGGFVDEVPFDPMEYGMPPNTLRSIEPLHLLTLQVVREAMKDAGYLNRSFNRDRTSVILGAGGGVADLGISYSIRSFLPLMEHLSDGLLQGERIISRMNGFFPEWTEDSFPGILMNVAAGRVANRFDLGGSNFTVDAACASSMAAVYLAVRELQTYSSDMVVVGGSDTMQNPFTYLCFSKTQALSPTGQSRPLDESADGIVLGEGVGIVILKRLADAERDGDKIYAVIKAVSSSSDGRDKCLTAPRPEGQILALKRAYAQAGISPSTVGLIEAHGTGTVAGDRAEVQALSKVFADARARAQSCAIGSVKSMIGHTKCTAGIAGLIKVAMALHSKVLPPTLGVSQPNKRANFDQSPFYVNTESRPWFNSEGECPRRAGVSAFGFGGTNFHAVLEEYTQGYSEQTAPVLYQRWPGELLLWEAKSKQDLVDQVNSMMKNLQNLPKEPSSLLPELAATRWEQLKGKIMGRSQNSEVRIQNKSSLAPDSCLLTPDSCSDNAFPGFRLAVVASSGEDLIQKLERTREVLSSTEMIDYHDPRGIFMTGPAARAAGKIAFLFPGQGSQYPNMAKDLALHFPCVRSCFERIDRILKPKLHGMLSSYIFPLPVFNEKDKARQQEELTRTSMAQPAIGAVSVTLCHLLNQLEIHPDMAAGHSYGEYVALWAGGAFSEESLMLLSAARGRIIEESADSCPGIMAAVRGSEEQVSGLVSGIEGVWIANYNSPQQIVVSGTPKAVQQVVDRCAACGAEARVLEVSCAFHSPLIRPAQERFSEFLRSLPMEEPKIAVYSNTTAAPHSTDPEAIADQLVRHLTNSVRFRQEIEAMYEAGARIFIEVGPKSVLTRLVGQILKDRPAVSVALDQPGRPGLLHLQQCLGQVFVQGVSVNLDLLYSGRVAGGASGQWSVVSGQSAAGGIRPSARTLSPTTWMVRGDRIRPWQEAVSAAQGKSQVRPGTSNGEEEERKFLKKDQRIGLEGDAPVKNTINQRQQDIQDRYEYEKKGPQAREEAEKIVAPGPMPRAEDQVMLQFQEMMNRFLETQKAVMLRYMQSGVVLPPDLDDGGQAAPLQAGMQGGEGESLPPQVLRGETGFEAVLSPSPEAASAREQSPQEEALKAEEKKILPASSTIGREQIQELLLRIVSERTGYPPEMLDLSMNMEADLGIDSIKRVEILGSFQREFSSSLGQSIEKEMESLSGVKTLQEIIDWIAKAGEEESGVGSQESGVGSQESGVGRVVSDQWSEVSDQPDAGAAPEDRPETPQDTVPAPVSRFILQGVETPCRQGKSALDKSKVVVITEDRAGLASLLATTLSEQGYKVVLVRPGNTRERSQNSEVRIQNKSGLSPDSCLLTPDSCFPVYYEADFGAAEGVQSLVNSIRQRQGSIGALIHLYPFRKDQGIFEMDLDQWRARLRLEVKSLFYFAKSLEQDFREAAATQGGFLMAVTSMGGLFGSIPLNGARSLSPSQGGCAGLIKSLKYEWPKVVMKAVDLAPQEEMPRLVQQLLNEMHCRAEDVEVGYCHGSRFTLQPIPAPIQEYDTPRMQIDSSWVILISGGARGITADVARELARRYQPILILLGRSALPDNEPPFDVTGSLQEVKSRIIEQMKREGKEVTPARVEARYQHIIKAEEIRASIRAIQDLGARVHYYQVDVRDGKSLAGLIDEIYTTFGRIDGLIHGAGIIEDKFIRDKTADSFDRVFDTKTDSAFILSQKIRFDSLKFMVFFSSVAGRFGNRGQGDYAAANEILNKLAIYLNDRWPGKIVSINWGPWENSNMVPPALQAEFLRHGVQLVSRSEGPRMLDQEICCGPKGEVEVILGGGGWEAALGSKGGSTRPDAKVFPLFAPGIAFPPNEEGVIEIVRELDIERDLYLQDHRLDGKPVLPMTMALELMAEVASLGWPEWHISQIRDMRVWQGIIVAKPTKVRIVATPLQSVVSGQWSVVSEKQGLSRQSREPGSPCGSGNPETLVIKVEIQNIDKSQRCHYSITIEMSKKANDRLDWQPPALMEARPFPLSTREAYQQMLFHGYLFQGITAIHDIGVNGIQGFLTPSDPHKLLAGNPPGTWLIDPVIMDCGLQMIILWSRTYWDMMPLPSRFRLFRILAPLSGARIRFEGRILPQSIPGMLHADLAFYTEEGQLIALLEDMEAACSKSLNRLAEKTERMR